jgi:hypothetical protein
MPQMNLWHDHHGRPNLLIYCEGAPLMVDSGCPNYDHFLRETYLTRSWAHNVLHVHEKPEHSFGEHWRQPLPEVAVTEFSPGRDRSRAVFTHRFRWAERRLDYTWTRTVLLEKASVGIHDHVESRNAITATLRFHFAPLNMMLSEDRRKATIFFHGRFGYLVVVDTDTLPAASPIISNRRITASWHWVSLKNPSLVLPSK